MNRRIRRCESQASYSRLGKARKKCSGRRKQNRRNETRQQLDEYSNVYEMAMEWGGYSLK
jgi:hypothetical protein